MAASVIATSPRITLSDLSATALLSDPLTVCFTPGADLAGHDVDDLCNRVTALEEGDASWEEWCMAVSAASTRGRKDAMIREMRRSKHALIIEDLIDIGLEEGIERGRLEGVQQGRLEGVEQGRLEGVQLGRLEGVEQGRLDMAREGVLELLATRALEPTHEERARIESETSLEVLKLWLRRAATSRSVSEVLA